MLASSFIGCCYNNKFNIIKIFTNIIEYSFLLPRQTHYSNETQNQPENLVSVFFLFNLYHFVHSIHPSYIYLPFYPSLHWYLHDELDQNLFQTFTGNNKQSDTKPMLIQSKVSHNPGLSIGTTLFNQQRKDSGWWTKKVVRNN